MKRQRGIAGYFQLINGILALSPAIKSLDVPTEKRTPIEGYLRGDVLFKNGSHLHFRELVTTEPNIHRISYTYHFQSAGGKLIFRYDDSDHFPYLPSTPHHKHIGENDVIAANAPDLQSVLHEIERMIKA